ncbi:hypothetical protein [Collimonas humicola]|uniref:hypothetical protein n=1 Tax=Collimonas humicola TaxID=2825886 RepID=UPI001B8AC763|nr:hypothetical protein [Collimonas humicola]
MDIVLATETNPAPDFIAHDEIALAGRYLALMMRAKTPAGRLGSGLGQQRKPVRSIRISSHARFLSLSSKKTAPGPRLAIRLQSVSAPMLSTLMSAFTRNARPERKKGHVSARLFVTACDRKCRHDADIDQRWSLPTQKNIYPVWPLLYFRGAT